MTNALAFTDLGLIGPLQGAIKALGFKEATPIQAQAIPPVMAGKDVLGIAQTGTGKTAAFALPILDRIAQLKGKPAPKTARVLILSPTRELAAQIQASIKGFSSRLRMVSLACVYGGVGKGPQARSLAKGVDILIATPGRLRDLMEDRAVSLHDVSTLVLDEADRMLDMGFAPEVRRLAKAMPADRQTILFSATMPKDIAQLAAELMTDPIRVEVAPQSTPVERIEQKLMFVDRQRKAPLLKEILSQDGAECVIVFTKTKRGADKVCKMLKNDGTNAVAIHGDKTQGARRQALADFVKGRAKVLVATDLAARGIDVDDVTHVVNYDLPVDAQSYIHRIGRTARAGKSGIALSFCAEDEVELLWAVQKLTRITLPIDDGHSCHSIAAQTATQARSQSGPGVPSTRPHGAAPGNRNKRRPSHGKVSGRGSDSKGRPSQKTAKTSGHIQKVQSQEEISQVTSSREGSWSPLDDTIAQPGLAKPTRNRGRKPQTPSSPQATKHAKVPHHRKGRKSHRNAQRKSA